MAGWFFLGGGGGGGAGRGGGESGTHQQQQSPSEIPPGSLFLFKNGEKEISFNSHKGFELWHLHQQQQQLHQQRLQENICSPSSTSDELSFRDTSPATAAILSSCSGRTTMRQGPGGGTSCQDCGNQAKKDCIHMRCRTCCKSRGFQCPTHVKSTWVPASRRRERQQQLSAIQQHQQPPPQQQQQRHLRGLEVGNFPAEVNSQAVFRCVRVSSIDEPDDQYAYQTAINIGGHVFKGILYDQGPEIHYSHGESSSVGGGGGGGPHNLIAAAATNTTSAASAAMMTTSTSAAAAAAAAMFDPSSLYPPTPLSAFMAGTQFFPPPRS